MKAIESLKQHVKNALIEMGEKYNQKFEEMSKYVNDTPGNQEKNDQTSNGNSSRIEN